MCSGPGADVELVHERRLPSASPTHQFDIRSGIRTRVSGFSLIELMVGIGIAMLGMLVMMQVSVVFEGRKRTTTSASDAQTTGMSALFAIERDVRGAGYGVSREGALGCLVRRSFQDTSPTNMALTPVTIVDGASGLPDTITTLASSKKSWSVPIRLTTDFPVSANNIFVTTTVGTAVGDLLVLFETGKACTLVEVTALSDEKTQVSHVTTGSKWNPTSPSTVFPVGGYTPEAIAINMGTLSDHTYRLAGNQLVLDVYGSGSNVVSTQVVASDIINLQAQYGFDTRSGARTDARVDKWSSVMLDADGNGTVGNAGDLARMVAVRIALVARSAQMERRNAAGVCDITIDSATTNPVRAANNPTWMAGNIATGVLETTAIDVSKNSDGTANANWKCYRYKVFETVAPLRNLLWKES
jgi:type IV pilus assembly protein PilW